MNYDKENLRLICRQYMRTRSHYLFLLRTHRGGNIKLNSKDIRYLQKRLGRLDMNDPGNVVMQAMLEAEILGSAGM